MGVSRGFACSDCSNSWQVGFGRGRPGVCPQCGSANIQKTAQSRGVSKVRKSVSKDKGRRWIR